MIIYTCGRIGVGGGNRIEKDNTGNSDMFGKTKGNEIILEGDLVKNRVHGQDAGQGQAFGEIITMNKVHCIKSMKILVSFIPHQHIFVFMN